MTRRFLPEYRLLFAIATIPELALVALNAKDKETLKTDEIKFRSSNDTTAMEKAKKLRDTWTQGNDYQKELFIPTLLYRGYKSPTVIEEYIFRSKRLDRTLKDAMTRGREGLN